MCIQNFANKFSFFVSFYESVVIRQAIHDVSPATELEEYVLPELPGSTTPPFSSSCRLDSVGSIMMPGNNFALK
jgi:hypothetical protein